MSCRNTSNPLTDEHDSFIPEGSETQAEMYEVDHFVGYEMPTQTIAMTPTHVIVDEDELYSYEI